MITKATPEGTLSYTYDGAGNVASMASSNANGASVAYTWNQLNRLSSVVDNRLPAGQNTTLYNYDPAGNLATVIYPNGLQSTFGYDDLNRLTVQNAAPQNYSYTLGPTGNRTTAMESSGRTLNWSYDGIYRLTQETISLDPHAKNGTASYGLDPVGNRLSQTASIPGISSGSFTYDADDLLSIETYDNNGNVLTSGGKTFAYDFENRLNSMNGGAVTILYDGDGIRVAKTVGGVTTHYLVDDLNPTGYAQVVDEIAGSTVVRIYTYGAQRISQSQITNSMWSPSFYGYDGGGTVRYLTNPAEAVTDTYDYDAWGNEVNSTGSTPNVYLYRGEQWDTDLGLYYLRARYGSPVRGRFLSRDAYPGDINSPSTFHKYLYANSEPVDRIDPSGRLSNLGVGSIEYDVLLGITAASGLAIYEAGQGARCIWQQAADTLEILSEQGVPGQAQGCHVSPQPQPKPQPAPVSPVNPPPPAEPGNPGEESVTLYRGVNANNPGNLRFDPGSGLSVYEVLNQPYPCRLDFRAMYDAPKAPGVIGQLVSVSNDDGSEKMAISGPVIFSPQLGNPTIGLDHWDIQSLSPDLRAPGVLRKFCPNSRFK